MIDFNSPTWREIKTMLLMDLVEACARNELLDRSERDTLIDRAEIRLLRKYLNLGDKEPPTPRISAETPY